MKYLEKLDQKRSESKDNQHKQAVLDAYNGLSGEIRTLLNSLEKTGAKTLDKDFVDAVKSLRGVADKIEKIKVTSDEDIKNGLRTLAVALSQIDVRPVVNVAAPRVEVKEREIDFKPLIKEMNRPESKSVLSDYFAQDIVSDDPNIQYIGFVNPDGNWYILECNDLDDSMRFKFGKKNYTSAIKKPAKHTYKLLNEALNEVSA